MSSLDRVAFEFGRVFRKITYLFILAGLTTNVYAQDQEKNSQFYHFSGDISLTNNGFSYIPAFSLGKPASTVYLSLGGERFSLDPHFRFDLNGLKPWSLAFIWRYKLIQTRRFQLKTGVHFPVYTFINETIRDNGTTRDQLIPVRFLIPELIPTYSISRNIGIGAYYVYGLELGKVEQTGDFQYLSFNFNVSQLSLGREFYLNWKPQFYYLTLDGSEGIYTAQSLILARRKFPISLGGLVNIKLKSQIPTMDFDWNVSLTYTFNNQFNKK